MTPTPQVSERSGPRRALRRHRSSDSERGATMMEFGLIGVLLFTIIFAIIEGAFAVRAINSIQNATQDAARRGAVAASASDADFQVLNQLVGRGADDAAVIEYVVVYRATSGSTNIDSPGYEVCKSGTAVPGLCNVYTRDEFAAGATEFNCEGGLGSDWCPTFRNSNEDGLGFLGVFVRARYEPVVDQLLFNVEFDVDADSLQVIQ